MRRQTWLRSHPCFRGGRRGTAGRRDDVQMLSVRARMSQSLKVAKRRPRKLKLARLRSLLHVIGPRHLPSRAWRNLAGRVSGAER